MKFNKWTMGLAAVGVVSLASAARADETKMDKVNTALSNTTLSGYVDVAAVFNPGGVGGGGYTYSALMILYSAECGLLLHSQRRMAFT